MVFVQVIGLSDGGGACTAASSAVTGGTLAARTASILRRSSGETLLPSASSSCQQAGYHRWREYPQEGARRHDDRSREMEGGTGCRSARGLLLAVCRLHDRHTSVRHRELPVSAEHIADEASAAMTLEASTVRGAIKRLRRYGWIQVDTDPGSKRLSCGRPCHPIIRLCAAAVMR